MDELLTEFLAETADALAGAEQALLQLEHAPDDAATLALLFRLVHTTKGSCAFVGLRRLERLADALEEVLAELRGGDRRASPAVVTAILDGIDGMEAILAGLTATGSEPPGDDTALLARLRRAGSADGEDGGAPGGLPAGDGAAPPTIRVQVATLEALMTLVGELVLTRNQMLQIAREDGGARFGPALQRLSHLTTDLQEGLVKTRMQPIQHAWATIPRLVRSLSAELGKQIDVVMRGGDTELDRQMLELVRGPLFHMVRNCADHGIEAPPVREALGKPPRGTILLNSFHQGGSVVIEVADDGAGLPSSRLRDIAVQRGLLSGTELARWDDQQLNRLIFVPGISTASHPSSVSGRGVGMDVVQTNVEQLGGTIDVRSTEGRGTRFIIRLPLTLAIIPALMVGAGGQRFALPQACVTELVHVDGDAAAVGEPALGSAGGMPVLRLRTALLPLVRLAAIMGLDAANFPGGPLTVVVARLGSSDVGLVVDGVFDTEEIVVKPVSRRLRGLGVYAGNTILGDGSVTMILDPGGLWQRIARTEPRADILAAAVSAVPVPADRPDPALLIRLGADNSLAVIPLQLIFRIETVARAAIHAAPGRMVTQYRDHILPLACPQPDLPPAGPVPLLVFSARGRRAGIVVGQIIDVVEQRLAVQPSPGRPGFVGTALVGGHVADVLDVDHWLPLARADWFAPPATHSAGPLMLPSPHCPARLLTEAA